MPVECVCVLSLFYLCAFHCVCIVFVVFVCISLCVCVWLHMIDFFWFVYCLVTKVISPCDWSVCSRPRFDSTSSDFVIRANQTVGINGINPPPLGVGSF